MTRHSHTIATSRPRFYSLRSVTHPRRCGAIAASERSGQSDARHVRNRTIVPTCECRVECMLKLVSPLGAERAAARLLNRRALSLRRRPSQNARRPVGPAPGSAGLDWGAGRGAWAGRPLGRPGPRAPDRRTPTDRARAVCRPSTGGRQAAGRADFSRTIK